MANKFNKGDVVVLKSGGVPMTVDGVPGDVLPGGREREEYRLVWQKGASPQQHAYPEHVLETYVKPANTTLAKK
jgi:uncharacterized protein YodC (DUF2158 family)